MPASGGRLGVKEPPPAATITTLARNFSPASVTRRKRPSSVRCERIDALAEVELGAEWLDLREQPIGQPLAGDDGQAGDIVDRLFRVELGALAADLVEDVDHMRLDVDEAEFEHREQTDRPGADDQGIGLDRRSAGRAFN